MHYIAFTKYGQEYFSCDKDKKYLISDECDFGSTVFEKVTCENCLKSKDYHDDIDYEFDDMFSNLNKLIESYKKISKFYKKNLSPEKWIEIAKLFCELEKLNNINLIENIKEDEFVIDWLFNKWYHETCCMSGGSQNHSCYKALTIVGKNNIKKMFELLKNHWMIVYALREILNDGPKIKKENYGKTKIIVQEWLNWGQEKGYIE